MAAMNDYELPVDWCCYLCGRVHTDSIHTVDVLSEGGIVNGKWMPSHYARYIVREGRRDYMASVVAQ